MARFVLWHRHEPAECRVAFAAWKGFPSPLRGQPVLASCAVGHHTLFWTVEAPDVAAALALLPPYLAHRTDALEVTETTVP
jgi:hypothetical protein